MGNGRPTGPPETGPLLAALSKPRFQAVSGASESFSNQDIKFQSHPSKPSLSHEFKSSPKPTKPTTTQVISQPSQVSASPEFQSVSKPLKHRPSQPPMIVSLMSQAPYYSVLSHDQPTLTETDSRTRQTSTLLPTKTERQRPAPQPTDQFQHQIHGCSSDGLVTLPTNRLLKYQANVSAPDHQRQAEVLVDSGATDSFASASWVQKSKIPTIPIPGFDVQLADGSKQSCNRAIMAPLKLQGYKA